MYIPNFNTKLLNLELILEKLDVASGMTIADFGCGRSGVFSFLMAEKVGKKGLIYALDIIKAHLQSIEHEAALHNFSNIRTIWTDLEGPNNIPNESVDIVLIINTLHQSQKYDNILKQAYRIAKKGGKIAVIDWLKISSPLAPEHRLNKIEVIQAAKLLGIAKHDEFMAGKYHFGLVFYK
ncbi:MAG: methyltransferase domain-containing protein [Candidatus Falkowbacteria bacterium]